MTKNEVDLVKALGDLEREIGSLSKLVINKVGDFGYTADVNKKLEVFKDKFFNILLDPEEET